MMGCVQYGHEHLNVQKSNRMYTARIVRIIYKLVHHDCRILNLGSVANTEMKVHWMYQNEESTHLMAVANR